jgi:NAD(P)-dependent dehydrogenase (short-subunit alcohol dehydrogenase family)
MYLGLHVSGGVRGIGGAAATSMTRLGATGYAADVLDKADRNSEAAQQPHPDVRESDQWQSLVDQIIERHGRLDVLVDVAGVTQRRSGIHDADFTE